MKSKFKIGDKVKVINDPENLAVLHRTGIVKGYDYGIKRLAIEFEGISWGHFCYYKDFSDNDIYYCSDKKGFWFNECDLEFHSSNLLFKKFTRVIDKSNEILFRKFD